MTTARRAPFQAYFKTLQQKWRAAAGAVVTGAACAPSGSSRALQQRSIRRVVNFAEGLSVEGPLGTRGAVEIVPYHLPCCFCQCHFDRFQTYRVWSHYLGGDVAGHRLQHRVGRYTHLVKVQSRSFTGSLEWLIGIDPDLCGLRIPFISLAGASETTASCESARPSGRLTTKP